MFCLKPTFFLSPSPSPPPPAKTTTFYMHHDCPEMQLNAGDCGETNRRLEPQNVDLGRGVLL